MCAQYASDVELIIDHAPESGDLKIIIRAGGGEAPLTRAQHNTLRTAALSGWSDLRTAWVAIDSAAGPWLDDLGIGLTTAKRDRIRGSLIWLLSARGEIPTPPSP